MLKTFAECRIYDETNNVAIFVGRAVQGSYTFWCLNYFVWSGLFS